jgi:hypothetical protein
MITKWYFVRYTLHEVLSLSQITVLIAVSVAAYGVASITTFYGYLYAYVHGRGSKTMTITIVLLAVGFLGALVGDQVLICFLIFEDVVSIARFIELRWVILSVSGVNLALWMIAAVLGYVGARQIRIAEGDRHYVPPKQAMSQLERKASSPNGLIAYTKARFSDRMSTLSKKLKRSSQEQ